jgi:hypothetical protein
MRLFGPGPIELPASFHDHGGTSHICFLFQTCNSILIALLRLRSQFSIFAVRYDQYVNNVNTINQLLLY